MDIGWQSHIVRDCEEMKGEEFEEAMIEDRRKYCAMLRCIKRLRYEEKAKLEKETRYYPNNCCVPFV